ncbi:MAG: hypothetical protein ABJL44_18455 [Algibacter sp.]
MTKFVWLICFFSIVFSGCKSASILEEPQNTTTQKITLGSVGLNKKFILQKEFNGAAVPKYQQPIKLTAYVVPFTKGKYKSFLKAKALQSSPVSVNYIDSIAIKPQYLRFKIADKVALIGALNGNENENIKRYLSSNSSSNLVTSLSVVFNKPDLKLIQEATAVFLVENGLKNYALQLYKDGVKSDLIQFNKGVVIEYNTSSCCWQEDNRHHVNIVDLVEKYNNCPNKTYRASNKAKKELKLF